MVNSIRDLYYQPISLKYIAVSLVLFTIFALAGGLPGHQVVTGGLSTSGTCGALLGFALFALAAQQYEAAAPLLAAYYIEC